MNVMLQENPGVTEDGIVIQSSQIAKFGFETYEKRVVEFAQRALPLNLYPDDPPLTSKFTDDWGSKKAYPISDPDDKEQ